MAGKKQQPRAKAKDTRKPRKKKVRPIVKDSIEYVDYKDVNLLKAFLSDRAKIRGSRVSGNNRQQQRQAAGAIKIAREMALLPYHMRVVTQRKGDKRGGGRGDRRVDDHCGLGIKLPLGQGLECRGVIRLHLPLAVQPGPGQCAVEPDQAVRACRVELRREIFRARRVRIFCAGP